MTPERWSRIKEVFGAALETPKEGRGAYLDSACGGDAELRREVEQLLEDSGQPSLPSPALGPLDPEANELVPAQIVAHYRVEAKIGAGGMGAVYRAYDTRLHRQVALKVLPPEQFADPEGRQRLMREARAASALNHPNIVTVHEIGSDRGVDFIAMEYVEGTTLAARLRRGPLPFEDVLRYGAQIAGAVATAHARGIIHRDLKPANIMLTATGAKVLDFGLAKMTKAPREDDSTQLLTAPHTVMGTLSYMAPEQLEGKEADERADIFALGLVLYEMACGRRVFEAGSGAKLIAEIVRCEPEPLTAGTPQFRRAVRRCLMKNPAERWHSAADVKIELEDPVPAGEAIAQAAARTHTKPLITAAVIAIALLAGFLVAAFWPLRPPPLPPVTPVATEFEIQTMPSWSPTGDRLAYVAAVDGVFQVFTKSIAGSAPVQRTKSPWSCFRPLWSADGTRIYFSARDLLWSVPVAGGEPEHLLNRVRAVSPDGRRLVFVDGRLGVSSSPGASPVWVEPFKLRAPGFPSYLRFAPNGSELGVSEGHGGSMTFWKIPMDGSAPRSFTTKALAFFDSFTWLPGGKRIIVGGIGDELSATNYRLAEWNLSSGEIRWLNDASSLGEYPALSPDGRTLAYVSGRQDYDIFELPLDGSGALRPVLESSQSELSPCWSPDGAHFAYSTNRGGPFELHLRDIRDGSERVIAVAQKPSSVGWYFGPCSFSPDGSRVAYDLESHIWIAPLSGETPVRLLPELSGNAPAWSPDGRSIAYYASYQGKNALMKVSVGGNVPQFLAPVAFVGVPGPISWSPKGDWIAFLEAVVSADGQIVRKFNRQLRWVPAGFGWSKDGSVLYGVLKDPDRRLKLGRVDLATLRETVLADLGPAMPDLTIGAAHGRREYQTFVVHPDGKRALLCMMRMNKSIYLMRNFDRRVRFIDALLARVGIRAPFK